MKDKSMMQYLSEIKSKVDAIGFSGSPLPTEDIILYTLNGLPTSYQAFKTAIRTNLNPISLDDFYSLLSSEEVNLAVESIRDLSIPSTSESIPAFYAQHGSAWSPTSASSSPIECQICRKIGHSAFKCWYRRDFSFQPSIQAYATDTSSASSEWLLDTGATSHVIFKKL